MIVCDRCGREADLRLLRVVAECTDSPRTVPGTERQVLNALTRDLCLGCFDCLAHVILEYLEKPLPIAIKR